MNLYAIILASVALGGIGISIWGWQILQKSRKIEQWPRTTGTIETSNPTSTINDLLPEIVFSYELDGKKYQKQFEFPEGTHPLPEFSKAYNDKYPIGKKVEVWYDPAQHEIATLEARAQGDWMILAMGIAMAIGGVLSLILI